MDRFPIDGSMDTYDQVNIDKFLSEGKDLLVPIDTVNRVQLSNVPDFNFFITGNSQ